MSHIYPYPVVSFKNESEERIYQLLQKKLGEDYTVFYGRTWSEGGRDHECDFIVTKPGSGIVIVEVKGGRWERRGGTWCCYGSPVKPADDPFEQAKANKYALIELLRSRRGWERTFFPISHAIALPDTNFPRNDSFTGLPGILTFDELEHVDYWIAEEMDKCVQSSYPHKATPEMVKCLMETLMKDYVVRLSENLRMDEQKLLIFTEEQMKLDRSLRNFKRLTVQGCAGSGKTLMALRQVRRLAQMGEVKKILFTCFNRELAGWLASNTEDLKGKVTTMPVVDYFEKHAKDARVITDVDKEDANYFDNVPFAFLEANEELGLKYDAIVVDEGQSFKKDWWEILESLLINAENSYFYIFYDDLQRIYQEVMNPVPGEERAVELGYNLRNTARIHRQATRFLPKEKLPDCSNVMGEPVWVHYYENEKGMQGALRKVLRYLIQDGGVSSKDIVILTPKKKKSFFGTKEKVGAYMLSPVESGRAGEIRYTTIQSFRGMERQVVVMAELDGDVKGLEQLVYLGASRARTKLVMLAEKGLEGSELVRDCEDITPNS